jgi:hypothetical protein
MRLSLENWAHAMGPYENQAMQWAPTKTRRCSLRPKKHRLDFHPTGGNGVVRSFDQLDLRMFGGFPSWH